FMLRVAPERVIRSRIAYLRLKHALGGMSLQNRICAPYNSIEEMGPRSRALIAPRYSMPPQAIRVSALASVRRTSCDLPRHISTRKINTGIFAIIEGRVAAP